MAYREFVIEAVDTSVVYLTKTEVMRRFGITQDMLHDHISKDHIDAFRFSYCTFFHPRDVERYAMLLECGAISRGDLPEPGGLVGSSA